MRAIIAVLALCACGAPASKPTQIQPLMGEAKGVATTTTEKPATPVVVPLAGTAKAKGSSGTK